jgi:cation diffusion facilitator CzcD-associated flavoprotein CzcO
VECLGAEWSDETQLWTVSLRNVVTGEDFKRTCQILVAGVGLFGSPRRLEVDGLSPISLGLMGRRGEL